MKQILIIFLFLPLLGCGSVVKNKQTSAEFNCPRVFFSTEDRIYIDNSISLDNVLIKANLNNFAINTLCQKQGDIVSIPLDLLIIATPMDNLKESEINFPIYISLLDNNNEILENQFFSIVGSLNKDSEKNKLIETDIVHQLKIITNYLDTSQLIIGFMLDEGKKDLLN